MMRFIRRIQWWVQRRKMEAELAEEIEAHRAMKEVELHGAGLSAVEVRDAQRKSMGNVTAAREQSRGVWIWPWFESVWQDVAYAIRTLYRRPGFSITAVLTLAVAIGLNTSVFTIFNATALRPWPVHDPGRVAKIHRVLPRRELGSFGGFSLAEVRYLASKSKTMSSLIAYQDGIVTLDKQRTNVLFVSGNYFEALGVSIPLGRGFLASEDHRDDPQLVAVLDFQAWQTRFGGDPGIVGKTIRVNDLPLTIVGVASEDFTGTMIGRHAMYLPSSSMQTLTIDKEFMKNVIHSPNSCCFDVAGRISSPTAEEAKAELSVLDVQFQKEFLSNQKDASTGVVFSGTSVFDRNQSERSRPLFIAMFTAVTLILLLACANVGNLLLARGAARSHEIGVRLSIGATRGRVIRQLLTESLLLATIATAIGIGIASVLPSLLLTRLVSAVVAIRLEPDPNILLYTLAIALLAAIIFGLAPALHGTRPSGQIVVYGRKLSLRSLLLGLQVAISVVLLGSAGLLVRGMDRAYRMDLGFSIFDVDVARFDLPPNAYDAEKRNIFFDQLADQLRDNPLASPFGFTMMAPLLGRGYTSMQLPGEGEKKFRVIDHFVTPGYLDTLRIPLIAGRNLTNHAANADEILINETMAKRYWPGESPLGQTVIVSKPRTVVGVVRDVHTSSLDEIEPTIYRPFLSIGTPNILVRHHGSQTGEVIRAAVARIDPRVQVRFAPLVQNLEKALEASRIGAVLSGIVGLLALALASVGVYGVFAFVVQQRTREIGVRMALGARAKDVICLIASSNGRALLGGLLVGFIGLAAGSKLIQSYLYGVSRYDLAVYVGIALLLALAGFVATFRPAQRAIAVDPVAALRHD